MAASSTYKALVLGGTGGVGKGVVRALALSPEVSSVTLLLRKETQLPPTTATENYDKFTQKLIDFDKITTPENLETFKGHDMAFYSIGVSQTAVNEQTYRKIELENALELASLIKAADIPDLHWVTGKGTKENSWFLFGKVKAEVEKKISEMGFRRVVFYRPAAVCTPERPLAFFKAINFCGTMAIDRDILGEVMVRNSLENRDGQNKDVVIMENEDMLKFHKNNKAGNGGGDESKK